MLTSKDKMELLRFYSELTELIELSKGQIKPFSQAEQGDEYSFLLYDDKKLHNWQLSDDNEENIRRYPIIADCLLMPEHEHDIISYWGGSSGLLHGLRVVLVIDDSNYSTELKNQDENKGWYIEVSNPFDDEDDSLFYIENGSYSIM